MKFKNLDKMKVLTDKEMRTLLGGVIVNLVVNLVRKLARKVKRVEEDQ